jgi:hypothetical protein
MPLNVSSNETLGALSVALLLRMVTVVVMVGCGRKGESPRP